MSQNGQIAASTTDNPRKSSGVVMDSRRFLSCLNDSAQTRVTFYNNKVTEMGKRAGKVWRLAALRANNLFIEEVDTGTYYVANHKREKGGKVTIESIQPIKIVEGQKDKIFQESCLALIDAIEENNQGRMAAAFNKMSAQRFSGHVVPVHGKVRTHDGVVRSINISTGESLDRAVRHQLVAAIVESLKDRVTVDGGVVVEGQFLDGTPFKLPVTKFASHKLVAKQMLEAAKAAYLSPGFQNRVAAVAKLIHEDKIDDAVKNIAPFLKENEEFTLLTRGQLNTLVENTLAAKGIFNQALCNDTALLVYRTNMRVNRDTIIREWRRVAKAAQHPTLLENVRILESAKNFENAVDRFLTLVLETISDREVTAEALATTLTVLRDRTPKIKESHELAAKLNDLIDRLRDKEFDDRAIYEAEDFIATVQEELTTGDDLQNFDAMPGDEPEPGAPEGDIEGAGQEAGAAMATPAPGGQPGIVFNAPLISIGGEAGEGLEGALGGGEGGEEEELPPEDLSGMMGGEEEAGENEHNEMLAAGAAGGGAGGGLPGMESKSAPARSITTEEWDTEKYGAKPWEEEKDDEECETCKCDPCECDDKDMESECYESADPYAYSDTPVSSKIGADYGAPAIESRADVRAVVEAMSRLADKHNLVGAKLQENLNDLAIAGMSAVNIRVPKRKLSAAVDQVIEVFTETCAPGPADPCKGKNVGMKGGKPAKILGNEAADDDDDDMEKECSEDQFKWGTIRRKRGFKRSAINQAERKQATSESKLAPTFGWIEEQSDGMLGEMNGVRFILDWGTSSDDDLVVLSEDGNIEVPVPAMLRRSAFAAAGKIKDADPAQFTKWLLEGIDQLDPESPEEAELLAGGLDAGGLEAAGVADTGMGDELGAELGGEELGVDDAALGMGHEPVGELGDDILGDEELEGAVVKIHAGPSGVNVQVAPEADVSELGDGGEGGEEGEEEDLGMEPVDTIAGGSEVDAETGDEPAADGEFPDFGSDEEEEEPDKPDFAEDDDITQPKSAKYTKEIDGNLREVPDADVPPDADDEVEGFGAEPKECDPKDSDSVCPTAKSQTESKQRGKSRTRSK